MKTNKEIHSALLAMLQQVEETHDVDRAQGADDEVCVHVDMRPAEFDELIKSAASAISQDTSADRLAIRLLVAAGYVSEEKANQALHIAHGFERGDLPPVHPTGERYRHFLNYANLPDSPWLRYAYYHGADVGLDRPAGEFPGGSHG